MKNLDGHLPPAMAQQVNNQGIQYPGELELEPGEYTLRVVVRDELTGKMGSLAAPVSIEVNKSKAQMTR